MTSIAGDSPSPIWRRLTVRHLVLMTPWIGIVIGASLPIRDNSFLWHIRAGDLQLAAGRVITADPFSYTMGGEPWRTQSWLADLLYGKLGQAVGGLAWVPWLLIICGSLVVTLVGWAAHRRSNGLLPIAFSLVVLMWLALPNLVPRPALFSFVLLALLVIVLDVGAEWAIPLILWVWAGLHGSFVLGLGLVVLDALRRNPGWRITVRRLVAAIVAVSFTAHGLGVWAILTSFFTNREALSFISEWASPDLLSISVAPYVLVLAAILVAATLGRITVRELWVVLPFLVFGFTSVRAIMPAAIVLVPFAASVWRTETHAEPAPGGPAWVNLAVAAAMVVLPLFVLLGFKGIDDAHFPVEAAGHLRFDPVWHDDRTGGYLIYASRLPVFIDDRAELYGADFFRTFVQTREGAPDWKAAFETHGIQQALVPMDSGLAGVLTLEGWHIDFSDGNWMVFSRT